MTEKKRATEISRRINKVRADPSRCPGLTVVLGAGWLSRVFLVLGAVPWPSVFSSRSSAFPSPPSRLVEGWGELEAKVRRRAVCSPGMSTRGESGEFKVQVEQSQGCWVFGPLTVVSHGFPCVGTREQEPGPGCAITSVGPQHPSGFCEGVENTWPGAEQPVRPTAGTQACPRGRQHRKLGRSRSR